MFRQAYQRGMLTIFYSIGSKPLAIWDTFTKDGYIKRFLDEDIKSMILEIGGTNVSTTYIVCPKGKEVLGVSMPFLVMVLKNLKKYFSFEVTILDETGTRRRFRISNFQSTTQVLPLCTVMPIGLSDGWNQINLNLPEFTKRAYKKQFVEVQKVKINANTRLRRVYFTNSLVSEDQLPAEYRLFYPLKRKPSANKNKITNTEIVVKTVDEIITPKIDQGKIIPPMIKEEEIIPPMIKEEEIVPPKGNPPSERVSSTSKSKGSMQVIKAVSRLQSLDEKSRMLEVAAEKRDEVTDVNASNVDTATLLQAEHATTALIKEKDIVVETASVTTDFLKEPSVGAAVAVEQSDPHAGTLTPIEEMG
nr:cilia- and flagella-associated protein 20-like [Helicoverpa armigera]